jgi:hypothetical protein
MDLNIQTDIADKSKFMEGREYIDQKLIKGLFSKNEKIVSETLIELRTRGSIEVLPALFDLYFGHRAGSFEKEILSLINDVKDPDAVPIFMDAIKKYKGYEGFENLVSACWQCGLDFSKYIDHFIELVIEDDYGIALEGFSVIEENVSHMTSQQRTARLEYVRSKFEFVPVEKKALVNELMSVINAFPGPFRLDTDHPN